MMRRAIRLARQYIGETAPNPAVGCVIAVGDEIVGTGAHQRAGTPHAEVHALNEAGERARGATAYVTLEPCNHHGKTPPCTEALIDAGVARVVAGVVDPNPRVSGKGLARLRAAGLDVASGCLERDCRRLIADFTIWTRQQRPFVIYKVAATLDGTTAQPGRGRLQISSEQSRVRVHRLRASCDFVLVGAGTWRLDDPDLRPRLAKPKHRVRRGVVSHELPMARGALATHAPEDVLWLVQHAGDHERQSWESRGAVVVELASIAPRTVLGALRDAGVYRLMLEGGATLAGAFLREDLIDCLHQITAPFTPGFDGIGIFEGLGSIPRRLDWQAVWRGRCGPDTWTVWHRERLDQKPEPDAV